MELVFCCILRCWGLETTRLAWNCCSSSTVRRKPHSGQKHISAMSLYSSHYIFIQRKSHGWEPHLPPIQESVLSPLLVWPWPCPWPLTTHRYRKPTPANHLTKPKSRVLWRSKWSRIYALSFFKVLLKRTFDPTTWRTSRTASRWRSTQKVRATQNFIKKKWLEGRIFKKIAKKVKNETGTEKRRFWLIYLKMFKNLLFWVMLLQFKNFYQFSLKYAGLYRPFR